MTPEFLNRYVVLHFEAKQTANFTFKVFSYSLKNNPFKSTKSKGALSSPHNSQSPPASVASSFLIQRSLAPSRSQEVLLAN